MIVTARQLEDLHRSHGNNGHVTLPYRARLTPLASDYVRARKLKLGYSDIAPANGAGAATNAATAQPPAGQTPSGTMSSGGTPTGAVGTLLWWCDGPCGVAKAAVASQQKESALQPIEKPADAAQLVAVIKFIAAEVKAGRASGAILLVNSGASALVLANRCRSLRAVLGTCLEAVEQGVQKVAANVLVIEYPHQTMQQVRNMLGRFARGSRSMNDETRRQIEELASCG